MQPNAPSDLIAKRYREVHGAVRPCIFDTFMTRTSDDGSTATLGYRWAGQGQLYVERYLDEVVEQAVSRALGYMVPRDQIVELGNLAAINGMAMVQLWGRAANDLASLSQVAVATLTAPVRAMFARIGLPMVELARARPETVDDAEARWGRYYELDPRVCAGVITHGQEALARHFARREARCAA